MLLLALLSMMNSDPAETKPPEPPAAQTAPSTAGKLCKDVMGRTVKCNPF